MNGQDLLDWLQNIPKDKLKNARVLLEFPPTAIITNPQPLIEPKILNRACRAKPQPQSVIYLINK